MQGSQNSALWQSKPLTTSSLLLEGSSSSGLIIPHEAHELVPSDSQALVITSNKHVITKVYTRGRFRKNEDKKETSSETGLVFTDFVPDYDSQKNMQVTKFAAHKRKPTPTFEINLRRSKRNNAQNDGFKPASPALTRKRAAMKKSATAQSSQSSKSSLFAIPWSDFPDLALIDQFINDTLVHPHIPFAELQMVAKETSGIPPMEVTRELLLAEGMVGQDRGQQQQQQSPNSFLWIIKSLGC
jgi:hypothetical protein